jgi:peptidoglycan/LPS O-acetylase OafA/YrhL
MTCLSVVTPSRVICGIYGMQGTGVLQTMRQVCACFQFALPVSLIQSGTFPLFNRGNQMTKTEQLTKAAPKQPLNALTGLRIVAAMWVLLHHFTDVISDLVPQVIFLSPVFERGGVGVDLFFMLSGFILAYTYLDELGPKFTRTGYLGFIRLRLARVYPVHLATLVSAAALSIGGASMGLSGRSPSDTASSFVQNLLLVQAWLNQPYTWNGVAWSVSAEWFVYLTFPFMALLIVKARSRAVLWLGVAIPLVIHVFVSQVILTTFSDDRPENVLMRVSASFVAGCFLYRVFADMPSAGLGRRWLAPMALAAIVGLCYVPNSPHAALLPFICFLILGLAQNGDPVSRLLSTRGFVFGGAVSYSFYMVHNQVLSVVRSLLPDAASHYPWFVGLGIILGSIGLVFGAAWLLYRFIEEPGRTLIRGKARRPVVSR